jgi:hypothetical protein
MPNRSGAVIFSRGINRMFSCANPDPENAPRTILFWRTGKPCLLFVHSGNDNIAKGRTRHTEKT